MIATVSFGESITNPKQIFKYRSIKELLEWQSFSEEQEFRINYLRNEKNPDREKLIKKKLPYIVASHFEPEERKSKNLLKTNSMIFDIDKIDNVEELFKKLTL